MPMEEVKFRSRSSTRNGSADRLQDLGGHVGGVGGALDLRQHHHELVAADAADGVHHAQLPHQALGDLLQHLVAGGVAERVVDVLEAVQVDEHHRGLLAVALARGQRLGEPVFQQAAVGQPGQRVVVGEVLRARLGLAPVGDLRLQALVGGLQFGGALGDRALEHFARCLRASREASSDSRVARSAVMSS